MFRELRYGVLFYLSALAGGLLGVLLWSAHVSHGPEETAQWMVEGGIGGAIIGGGLWLYFKQKPERRWLAYCLIIAIAIASAALTVLVSDAFNRANGGINAVVNSNPHVLAMAVGGVVLILLLRLLPLIKP